MIVKMVKFTIVVADFLDRFWSFLGVKKSVKKVGFFWSFTRKMGILLLLWDKESNIKC